jgi:uncharacterized protein (TIGR03435 family)
VRHLTFVLIAVALAQEPATQQSQPQFEVVSVKPADGSSKIANGIIRNQPGRWRAVDVTLVRLIESAYPEYANVGLITGGPAWARDKRFTIDATFSGNASPSDVLAMLGRLLAERFGLRTHTEQRTLDVYALKLAREDGRLGPNLVRTAPECVEAMQQRRVPRPSACERFQAPSTLAESSLTFSGAPVTRILEALKMAGGADRPLLDRTGLTGPYDIYLHFNVGFGPVAGSNTDGLSMFAALQDQLGLKLERARESLNVLVIDGASIPEPN